jgi:hypothetical protein
VRRDWHGDRAFFTSLLHDDVTSPLPHADKAMLLENPARILTSQQA